MKTRVRVLLRTGDPQTPSREVCGRYHGDVSPAPPPLSHSAFWRGLVTGRVRTSYV